jgi:hypothetical protein
VSITRRIRSNLNSRLARFELASAVLMLAVTVPVVASADPVFINQPGKGGEGHFHGNPSFSSGSGGGISSNVPPEMLPPGKHTTTAESLMVGNYNSTAQLQAGHNNHSIAGILGGSHDHLNIVQAGNGLQSNIWLINPPSGVTFNYVQPPNSPPIDAVIIRLPTGQWIVKR